ncbi:hypothetical protein EGM70_06635 [Enterobacteriaceae bacterium 89]|nr:hypothetical protein [Enterobacteriaceae bacterium 89]
MKTEVKETPINLQANTSQRDFIDRATALTDVQYNAFVEALELPVTDNEGLKRLLNRKFPWD